MQTIGNHTVIILKSKVTGERFAKIDGNPRIVPLISPKFDAQAEIRAMGERLRWLVAHDNDAPRYILENIDAVAYESDMATELSEDLWLAEESAEKEAERLGAHIDKLREHIAGLIVVIDDFPESLTAAEREDPENVVCLLDAYPAAEAAAQQFITDNMLRK